MGWGAPPMKAFFQKLGDLWVNLFTTSFIGFNVDRADAGKIGYVGPGGFVA